MDNALALNYTGAWRDPVCDGLPLGNGYRTYLPDLMRFNAPDVLSPFGKGGANPYTYCSGDPINFADPSGLFEVSWSGGLGILAALLGVGLAIFTEGSSLAIAGAILGVVSAGTGIAADNTEGTAHEVLMGSSILAGIASVAEAGIAGIPKISKAAVNALVTVSSDIGRGAQVVTSEGVHAAGTLTARLPRATTALGVPIEIPRPPDLPLPEVGNPVESRNAVHGNHLPAGVEEQYWSTYDFSAGHGNSLQAGSSPRPTVNVKRWNCAAVERNAVRGNLSSARYEGAAYRSISDLTAVQRNSFTAGSEGSSSMSSLKLNFGQALRNSSSVGSEGASYITIPGLSEELGRAGAFPESASAGEAFIPCRGRFPTIP